MSKVLIEFEKLRHPYCGLGTVCTELGKALIEENKGRDDLLFYLPKERFNYFGPEQHYLPINKIHRKLHFLGPKSDVYHVIHQDSPYRPCKLGKKTPLIMTIQDLNFLYEEKGNEQRRLRSLQKRANHVDVFVCTSHFGKKDLEAHIKIRNDQQVLVCHLGVSPAGEQISRPKDFAWDQFFFAVGVILPKKNFHVLIDMMKRLPDKKLVIAGTTYHPYAQEMRQRVQEEQLTEQIFFPGEITTEEKNWYLEHCEALFHPSKVEGFGLPPLEAMQRGKPVFVSTCTAIPEISGPEAYYFENFDPEHMAEVYQRGMDDFQKSDQKKKKLLEWVERYNWSNCAKFYLDLYRSLT